MLNITWTNKKTAMWIRKQTGVRDVIEDISKSKKLMDMGWTYRQKGRQRMDHEVDKLHSPYIQSNAWPTYDEMA